MNNRISMLSVAQEARCSIATVSNVLNNKGRVGSKKREIVQNAIRTLGYQTHCAGRNLRMRRSEMVGLLFYPHCAQFFKNPFYAEIMEGLEEGLTRAGYHLLLADRQASVINSPLPDFLTKGKVDGMVLLGHVPHQLIQKFSELSMPLLLLDSSADWPVDSGVSDGYSAQIAVVHHLAARGHRSIILAVNAMEDHNIDLRLEGFLAGLRQCHLDFDEGNIIRDSLSHGDIYARLRERMTGPNLPTAIIAVNDILAMELYKRFAADRIPVPDRMSIIGYNDDDAPVSLGNRPFLSNVRINRKDLGRVGAELILKQISASRSHAASCGYPWNSSPKTRSPISSPVANYFIEISLKRFIKSRSKTTLHLHPVGQKL